MRQILHRDRVVDGQFPALAHLFGGKSKVEGLQMKGENDVGTDAADDFTNIVVQPAHHRGNADDDRYTNYDA